MKIVIAGAGAVGFHLSQLLSIENQDITVIDSNEDVLMHVSRHLDVMTIHGDAASINVLEQIKLKKTRLFIAVTASEKTNILAAALAKQLGVHTTIARISNTDYIEEKNKERFKKLGVDVLISPQKLAAMEIERLLQRASFTDLYDFENGKITIVDLRWTLPVH